MLVELLFLMALIALPVSAITVTITRASVFAPVREWISKHNRWLGKLVTCPYCMSHWVGLALVVLAHYLIDLTLVVLPFTLFGTVALATFVSRAIIWAMLVPPLQQDKDAQYRDVILRAQQTIREQQQRITELESMVPALELHDPG